MTQTLEQLVRQEQTLDSIRGIVRTMKTLAAVNIVPYEQAALAIDGYQRIIREGFSAFAWRMRGRMAVDDAVVQRHVLVAFGSDHGFCGSYNETVAGVVGRFLDGMGERPRAVLCVGARLEGALLDAGISVSGRLAPPASVDGIGRLAGSIVTRVEQLGRGVPLVQMAVHLAGMRRAAANERVAAVSTLLPLERTLLEDPGRWHGRALPDFSMEPAALLSALLRNHVFASVFGAAAEALVTENAARLAVMQQAEKSVDERLEGVRRQLSSKRQDQVTEELMDIVIGHMQ